MFKLSLFRVLGRHVELRLAQFKGYCLPNVVKLCEQQIQKIVMKLIGSHLSVFIFFSLVQNTSLQGIANRQFKFLQMGYSISFSEEQQIHTGKKLQCFLQCSQIDYCVAVQLSNKICTIFLESEQNTQFVRITNTTVKVWVRISKAEKYTCLPPFQLERQ